MANPEYYFGRIDEVEFEFDAFDYLSTPVREEDSSCLEAFFKDIGTASLKLANFDHVAGHIWNFYVCNHIIEVLRVRPHKIVVTKVYPGITSALPRDKVQN